mgnify:CR=1 FL=1
MTINIIRGQNQIGGSIIEVKSDTTRLILDAGLELDDTDAEAPEVEGLFQGKPSCDAVLISHYHGDHIGLLEKVLPGIPIYMGAGAFSVSNAARGYLGKPLYEADGFFESGKPFVIGDITVTPYLCDHSAFDSYMIYLSCKGKTALYTGDFRANGRKSFSSLLHRLPHADTLITEGTTLTRERGENRTEADLELDAVKAIQGTDAPVFVLMAATNIDRIVTMYKAARKTGRIFAQDLYMATVACAAGGSIPNPKSFTDVRAFMTFGGDKRYAQLQEFREKKIGRAGIARSKFVMCVRPSMRSYLEKLSDELPFDGGIMFYSMWEGYRQKEDVAEFLLFMKAKGVTVLPLHTSGHADAATIDSLVRHVAPITIIPVHTENAAWFDRYNSENESEVNI